ncbi:MAG TPA: CRISPR-associated endonuclease Cas3'' [Bacteroidota bacterium]|nr:CRISPR-associated endonuclease Cas3'' [Bacteroidota bacterium]
MDARFLAHVRQNTHGEWEEHHLDEHLAGTAKQAAHFAKAFGNRDWAELLGYWHDLGKFHPAWQKYLRRESGYDEEAHVEGKRGRPNHSGAGAILALEKGNHEPPARVLAYAIAGHHGGLANWVADLESRLIRSEEIATLKAVKDTPEASAFLSKPIPQSVPCVLAKANHSDAAEHFHLWIRMLFSCLADADFLDTEAFMEPEKAAQRGNYASLQELKRRFDSYIERKETNAPDTPINRKRKYIREQCIAKAHHPPGFFSLTVPTGGGKTLSSMAFALEHALRHNKQRIIVAIPYTSIIEQTANIFKYGTDNDDEIEVRKRAGDLLFGEDQVVEHHSNLDPEKENARNRLASENWDAPIIVTTNVQLFESLFANKPSACRKLHNIVNSVIILDEVQLLPPEFLKPILSVLRGLVDYFGVTVVMMTATQPALEGTIGNQPNVVRGIDSVTPIIEDPELLVREFSRVELSFPQDLNERKEWESIRDELLQHEQLLCIVNSRKDCLDLHSLMPEGTVHLSALMCGEERSVVIADIKEKLRKGEPIRVISTQLVEAGVDIDFPVVYRALGGFDSIAQAAGRCNREGRLPHKGKVVVFVPPRPAPRGLLLKGEQACQEILRTHVVAELSPQLFREYFTTFYYRLNDFDKPKFYDRLVRNAGDFSFEFKTLAQEFNLIDEVQQSIVVWYTNPKNGNSSEALINELRHKGPNRELMRKLQRFLVNVHFRIFEKIQRKGFVEEVHGYWVQNGDALYKPGLGLQLDDTKWLENSVI